MINEQAHALGSQRSCIRELYEYGRARAAVVGEENVFDYSLGNPSIPAPREVDDAIRTVLQELPSLQVHGYTSAGGDLAAAAPEAVQGAVSGGDAMVIDAVMALGYTRAEALEAYRKLPLDELGTSNIALLVKLTLRALDKMR